MNKVKATWLPARIAPVDWGIEQAGRELRLEQLQSEKLAGKQEDLVIYPHLAIAQCYQIKLLRESWLYTVRRQLCERHRLLCFCGG